jgi:hypothetical protein
MQKFLEAAAQQASAIQNEDSFENEILPITSTRSNKSNASDKTNDLVRRSKSFEGKNNSV